MDTPLQINQSVTVEVERTVKDWIKCSNCGNKRAINARCEYCGEHPKEKE